MSVHGKLSKETELEAIELISSSLQSEASVRDMSDSQDYDFEILYSDGRKAIGEIGLLADPEYESAWASLRKRENHHVFNLPVGYGTWGTHLYGKPNINRFEEKIDQVISELNTLGIEQFQIGMHLELPELSEKCEALGIQYLMKHVEDPRDRVVYFLDMGHTFMVDPTLESLVKCVEHAILYGEFQDSWRKLLPLHADEKHIVLKCGSLIPLNHQNALLKVEPLPHIPEIIFPVGITHIWLIPNYVEAYGILWSIDGKKSLLDRESN